MLKKASSRHLVPAKLAKVHGVEEPTPQKPRLIPRPMFGSVLYNIPGASIVRIIRLQAPHYEGCVYINPKNDEGEGKSIRLIDAIKVNKKGQPVGPELQKPVSEILKFHRKEIDKVYIIKAGPAAVRMCGEIVMNTFVVNNKDQFKNVMSALTEGVSEVGVKFFGYELGRSMDLYWILLCARNTIIPIDMREIGSTEVWRDLKTKLFENNSIVKIFHDLRSETDYLFHRIMVDEESIGIKNVFDTQMAMYFMDTRQRVYEEEPIDAKNPPMSNLTVCLKRFLNDVVWDREILFLNECENSFKVGKFAVRPLPEPKALKCMTLSVKYLSRLKTALLNELLLCYNTAVDHMVDFMKQKELAALEDDEWNIYSNTIPEAIREPVQELTTSLNVKIDEDKLRSSEL